jgi:thiamine pyrophosphokinase
MDCRAEIVSGSTRILMADGETFLIDGETKPAVPLTFSGRPGGRFSVLSYAECSSGVYVQNVKYELVDAILTQSYPLGACNEFINTEPVIVSVRYGRLLIIIEG